MPRFTYSEALHKPVAAAKQIRAFAECAGKRKELDRLLDKIPSQRAARRLVITSRCSIIRMAAVVWLGERDPERN